MPTEEVTMTSARRRQPERVLQTALVEHLRLRARKDALYFAVPNGGSRDVREAANLKRAGVLPGVADLLLFRPGACPHCGNTRLEGFALELKASPSASAVPANRRAAPRWRRAAERHRDADEALKSRDNSPGGRPTEAQLAFMARFADAGGHTC